MNSSAIESLAKALAKCLAILLFVLSACPTRAGNATWRAAPTSGDWNKTANWTPATIPNGNANTANFATSSITNLSISADTEVSKVVFAANAPPFSIAVPFQTSATDSNRTLGLTISGSGIVNSSGATQTFVIEGDDILSPISSVGIVFKNAASAGSSTVFTLGESGDAQDTARVSFSDSSSAGAATFVLDPGGTLGFSFNSSAGSAHIKVNGNLESSLGFYGSASAGNALIEINDFSSAQGLAGNRSSYHTIGRDPRPDLIIVIPHRVIAGFNDSATAADSIIFNHQFSGLAFSGNSTAGRCNLTNTGGNALNNGSAGYTEFDSSSNAGAATVTNEGGMSENRFGGTTRFANTSSAGNGRLTNGGGVAAMAVGGYTEFRNTSRAEAALLIANGGTNGGGGGRIYFRDDSIGSDLVEVRTFGNGALDLSPHNAGAVSIGSIRGDGAILLGANQIQLGSGANVDSDFTGVIQDGGSSGGSGGSLSKTHSTNLTLSGANTYTGGTEVFAGTLLINNASGSGTGSGPIKIDNGSKLGGTGTIHLPSSATLINEGIIEPGAARGRFNIDGNVQLDYPSTLSFEIGGATPATQYDVLNKIDAAALNLNGKLALNLTDGFAPQSSDVFTIVTTQTNLGGAFTNVISGERINTVDGSGSFQVNYAALNSVILSNFGPPLVSSQNQNLATRVDVGSGDNVAIVGFIISGTEQKKVIVRGIGPSLSAAGLSNVLANPTLELHDPNGVIATNDDWKEHQNEIAATGLAPMNDAESAIVATLQPGSYTAILAGKNGGSGIGLVEIYDLDPATDARLANLSTRGFVGTGDDVLIGGLIAGPNNADAITILVRAVGPTLGSSGIANPLQDPVLELHDGNGALLAANNNWKDVQQADIEATGLPPGIDAESALLVSLAPGSYTAIVAGANNTRGVALVEVYEVQPEVQPK